MESKDKEKWAEFNSKTSDTLSVPEVKLISELHAKYFKHKYYVPCSCNPKTIVSWIKDLNKINE